MTDPKESVDEVLRFIVEEIDNVPDLEALLLLWQHRSKSWSAADLGRRLYSAQELRARLSGWSWHVAVAGSRASGYTGDDIEPCFRSTKPAPKI